VVALAAAEDGKEAKMYTNDSDEETEVAASDWVLSLRVRVLRRSAVQGSGLADQADPGLTDVDRQL